MSARVNQRGIGSKQVVRCAILLHDHNHMLDRCIKRPRVGWASPRANRGPVEPADLASFWYSYSASGRYSNFRSCAISVSFGRRLTAFFFATSHVHSQEVQFPVSVSRSAGDAVRQQTPYRCQSRNHGLCASISSCRRFAAERSLALNGLISSASNISSSCSMSSIVRSMSIPSQYATSSC
jgi:hypothetical protein